MALINTLLKLLSSGQKIQLFVLNDIHCRFVDGFQAIYPDFIEVNLSQVQNKLFNILHCVPREKK